MEKITNKRVCAFLIDLIIVAVINIFTFRVFHPRSVFLTTASIEFVYFLLKDSLIQGQSIGKWVIGIRVVNIDGNKCGFKQYLLRNILFAMPLVNIICFISEYFVMAYSKDGLRLGDRLAKTRVIDTRPHLKDKRFFLISLLLVFVFFFAVPLFIFNMTRVEAERVVGLLQDYKAMHGAYPDKLEQLSGFKPHIYDFVYTPYFYNGESEFFFTGITPLHPRKVSYNSQRKEWRIHRGAMTWSKEELRLDPDFEKADLLYRRGIELQKKGLIKDAIQAFTEAVRTKPDYLDFRLGLGFALMNNGQLDEALNEYKEAIRLKPGNLEARLDLYLILFKQKRYKEALEAYREYIKLMPPKNEKEAEGSDKLIRFMEEQAVSSVKEEVKPETKEDLTTVPAAPKVGNRYSVRLKNGEKFTATLIDKDNSGLWLEVFKGGRVYFNNEDIKEMIEIK